MDDNEIDTEEKKPSGNFFIWIKKNRNPVIGIGLLILLFAVFGIWQEINSLRPQPILVDIFRMGDTIDIILLTMLIFIIYIFRRRKFSLISRIRFTASSLIIRLHRPNSQSWSDE